MSEENEIYQNRIPEMDVKDVIRFWGKSEGRGRADPRVHECYVLRLRDGYQIATKTADGDWEIGTVTDRWKPNQKFYDRYEHASVDDFPAVEADSYAC